jgi:hypothetical protein
MGSADHQDPNYNYNLGGTNLPFTSNVEGAVLAQFGVNGTLTQYGSSAALLLGISSDPTSVQVSFNPGSNSYHTVTVQYDPNSFTYTITNPSGVVGVGGSISVPLTQMFGPIQTNYPSVPYAGNPIPFYLQPQFPVVTGTSHSP